MKEAVLAISAPIGAGKTTLSIQLARALNYKYASFGNYVRKVASEFGYFEAKRSDLQKIGEFLIEKDTKAFCQSVLVDSEWVLGSGLVVDGLRHLQMLRTLSELVHPQSVYLIFVTLDEGIRLKRLQERGENEQHDAFDRHSTELQVLEILGSNANYTVNGSELIQTNVKKISSWLENALQSRAKD